MLEMPVFRRWKRLVYDAATALAPSDEDLKRLEVLFQLFADHRCRRTDVAYDGLRDWLENAEREFDRIEFAAVVASSNPRSHAAVLTSDQLHSGSARWAVANGVSPERTPQAIARALHGIICNSRQLHLIDPHFGPENARHRRVLEALIETLSNAGARPALIRVHCEAKSTLDHFENSATQMARRIPSGYAIEFVRWRQRTGGDLLHNRFVLTELGGALFGVGLDDGKPGETDDVILLTKEMYERRWAQFVDPGDGFDCADKPATLLGNR
ncbi:MAG: hypothetical protein KDJ14_03665 [Xanthomonadales bacterium]|nr:hypothetical protein [Xanthomonadales bacterium]